MIDIEKLFFSRSRYTFNGWSAISTIIGFCYWNWENNFDFLNAFYLKAPYLFDGDVPDHVQQELDRLAIPFSTGLTKLTIISFVMFVLLKLFKKVFLNPDEVDHHRNLVNKLENDIYKNLTKIEDKLKSFEITLTRFSDKTKVFNDKFKETQAEIDDINRHLANMQSLGASLIKLKKQTIVHSNELNKVIAQSLHRAMETNAREASSSPPEAISDGQLEHERPVENVRDELDPDF